MEPEEIEAWVAEVVEAMLPSLLAQARMCDRLRLVARPPEEVAERLVADVMARLRAGAAPDA